MSSGNISEVDSAAASKNFFSLFIGFCMELVLFCGTVPLFSGAGEPDLRGAWKIEGYELKDGGVPRVRGTIFFPSGNRMRFVRSSLVIDEPNNSDQI